ncbi:MAG TPA: lytic transglycosylase domain-containing protein [Blastocatellia bacterium]|nr:lytic transglycosylase domain-containing protein [Blastocatellia bacterium]
MRSSVIISAIILLGLMATRAAAQDASINASFDSNGGVKLDSQRTPKLTVYENPSPVQAAKPVAGATGTTPGPAPGSAKNGATGAAQNGAPQNSGQVAGAQSPATTPRPMVLSGAQPSAQAQFSGSLQSTGNPVYDDLVLKAAARHGVDPNLIFSVMRQESGFNYRAKSYKGATGLMQLMPATARRFGVQNIYDPAQNIEGGTRYLRFLLDTFNGDVGLALAGYNAGEGAVMKYGYQVPPYRETRNYVRSITAKYGHSKHTSAMVSKAAVAVKNQAPAAAAFSGGSSTRLSNNY